MERMKMSERIAAAASQPTPEQVRAAHEALGLLRAPSQQSISISCAQHLVDAIAKFIPPLPEPERPRITPARELAKGLHFTAGHFSLCETAVRAARSEIIALLEWEGKHCEDPDCQGCYLRRRWIHEFHSADTP